MCGLFGVMNYGQKNIPMKETISSLAHMSAERGIDATGIAYLTNRKVEIQKAAKSAYQFKFELPKNVAVVMGHTRHSTQGSEKRAGNNHPFRGYLKNHQQFALAHNGVLSNDKELRRMHRLPKSNIETDSYIAVQLLEKKGTLSMEHLKFMAEQVQGSFTFSLIDQENSLYLVKGDSPLSLLHFKEQKIFVYASTEKILWKALVECSLFELLKKKQYEEIQIKSGEILKIHRDGRLEHGTFHYDDFVSEGCSWWNYSRVKSSASQHLTELKQVASAMGIDPSQVDELHEYGYTYDEIESLLYDPAFFEDTHMTLKQIEL